MARYRLTFLGRVIVILISLIVILMITMIISFYNYRMQINTLSNRYEKNKHVYTQKILATVENVEASSIEKPEIQKKTKKSINKNRLSNLKLSIYFEPNTTTIKQEYKDTLNMLLSIVKDVKEYSINIEGNCATLFPDTNNINNSEVNYKISLSRAKNVANYLIKNGIDQSKLTVKGNGSTKPLGDNNKASGRAYNRRVDILLIKQ